MLLALYTACSLVPLFCLAGLMLRLLLKKRADAILCTECQSCIARCPGSRSGVNAYDIMRWAKTGGPEDPLLRRLSEACAHCDRCRRDCPRGLSPHALLPAGKGESGAAIPPDQPEN